MTKNKVITWGITGGIAAYKSLDAISDLKKKGYTIHVIMTEEACKFIQPLTFEAISGNRVLTSTFQDVMAHIDLAKDSDLFIISPATFNIIGKIATGIADDLLTTIASAITSIKLIAPAMNHNMYSNPILKKNLDRLKESGYQVIEPDFGILACGDEGLGRLRNTNDIINKVEQCLSTDYRQLDNIKGKKILITAGGTTEPIDPIRFIGNLSSGKMGLRFAEASRDFGAEVTLIYSEIKLPLPSNMKVLYAQTAKDLLTILKKELKETDILVMTAAVGDFKPVEKMKTKIKKTGSTLKLTFEENPDILKTLYPMKKKNQFFVGFAAESENLIDNAKNKLEKKQLDLIIANDISNKDIAFDSEENQVTLIFPNGKTYELAKMEKYKLSIEILTILNKHFK